MLESRNYLRQIRRVFEPSVKIKGSKTFYTNQTCALFVIPLTRSLVNRHNARSDFKKIPKWNAKPPIACDSPWSDGEYISQRDLKYLAESSVKIRENPWLAFF